MIDIMIVDDHPLIIDGFETAVKQKYPHKNIFTAQDDQKLFSILQEYSIGLLFLDIRLARSDARDFVKKLHLDYPDMKIIIISSLDDLPTIETLFKQGVHGYLLKSDPKSEIYRAIDEVQQGERFFSRSIQDRYFTSSFNKPSSHIRLTPREKDVLSLILKGKTSKEISQELKLSEKTIENHRYNLLIKFKVKNVAGLVKKAILEGYL